MEYKDRFEKSFIQKVEAFGLYLDVIVPHMNYEMYYFYRDFGNTTLMVQVGYSSADEFVLYLGFDNEYKIVDEKFGLTQQQALNKIKEFCEKNGVGKKPHDPKVD